METTHGSSVRRRYAAAASRPEKELCCPVQYDGRYLKAIPPEVIERDYGCGDPSRYLRPGETVLDLGSGTGKICFIASQVVGPQGRVIGVDVTDEMLEVARRNAPIVSQNVGYANVEFRKGRIQDLGLDLEALERELQREPVANIDRFLKLDDRLAKLRAQRPLVADGEIDVVVSNCVLNLVDPADKGRLFKEIHRVLRPGGRAVISDIVSDQPVPQDMQQDEELWSGCISGALTVERFLQAFGEAGFHGVRYAKIESEPWRVARGIAFRSATVEAFKEEASTEQADVGDSTAIYNGPFAEIRDDAGHVFRRGESRVLGAADARRLSNEPYAGHFTVMGGVAGGLAEDEEPCCGQGGESCCG